MKAFRGLMQKEWLIGKSVLLWLLLAQAGLVFVAYLLAKYFEVAGLFYISSPMVMLMHPLIMIFLICSRLNVEGKAQVWLYNPQSSGMLLGSKLLISVLFQGMSLLFACLLTFVTMRIPTSNFGVSFHTESMMSFYNLLQMGIFLMAVSLFLALVMLFLWVVYHALARVSAIKPFRWLIVSLLFIGMVMVGSWYESTAVYQQMDTVWVVDVLSDSSFTMSADNLKFYLNTGGISLLTTGLDIITLVLLFLASCWLLDRKIEV
ncbi:hypothetical protein ACQKL0_05820 [Peribacillus sp. NPDC097264]|uniref:hypothetical protein n=1 Tax=unclassified Peribacillus TaxID=2675266 RepID=UPI00382D6138